MEVTHAHGNKIRESKSVCKLKNLVLPHPVPLAPLCRAETNNLPCSLF